MLRLLLVLLCVWSALVSAQGSSLGSSQGNAYTLNAGDAIRIHVYGEPDLTFDNTLVGENGRISYPFLGELKVTGKTVSQLQETLTAGLKPDYLVDPRISVSIVSYRPFFVNGEVKSPGAKPFQPGLTLRKAISLAGGFTERANKKVLLVIADDDPEFEETKVGLDYRVRPGDIITVQDTFF
jgi:polysaccharide biosynthesis/export protein VpsN